MCENVSLSLFQYWRVDKVEWWELTRDRWQYGLDLIWFHHGQVVMKSAYMWCVWHQRIWNHNAGHDHDAVSDVKQLLYEDCCNSVAERLTFLFDLPSLGGSEWSRSFNFIRRHDKLQVLFMYSDRWCDIMTWTSKMIMVELDVTSKSSVLSIPAVPVLVSCRVRVDKLTNSNIKLQLKSGVDRARIITQHAEVASGRADQILWCRPTLRIQ